MTTIVGKSDIIDWYDGVISALVDVGAEPQPHLCLALAWSPDYDVRVYGLVPITREVEASLRRRLGKTPAKFTWNDITDAMSEVVSAYSGPVLVLATESVGSEVLGEMTLPAAEIPELRLHKDRVERTYDEARLKSWLERLGAPGVSWREKERLDADKLTAKAVEFLRIHLARLDSLLASESRPSVDRTNACFVLARNVKHEPVQWAGKPGIGEPVLRQTVARKDLMTTDEYLVVLAEFLEGGPSWVHANLTRTTDGDEIIDIDAGAAVGARWPSPNASFTPRLVHVQFED